jgi:hypothetical protein
MSGWFYLVLVVIAVVVVLALAGGVGQTLASKRADRLRKVDPAAAETLEAMRVTAATRAALPMHDRSFDRPR